MEFVPPSTLRAVVRLGILEEALGERGEAAGELLASRVASTCFGGRARIERGYSHIVVEGEGGGSDYGFLERCVEELEREFLGERGVVEHYVLMFPSRDELAPFKYSAYCLEGQFSRGIVHRVVGLAAHALRGEGLECVSFGRRVVCYEEGASLREKFEVETLLGRVVLVRCGEGFVVFDEEKGRSLAARFVSFALRDAFRSRGFRVWRSSFFEGVPVFTGGGVVLRRGASFMVRVSWEGVVRVFLSPRFSVEGPPLYEYSEELLGARVKSELLDVSGVIRGFKDGVFLVDIGGYVVEVEAGRLRRVYGMAELEEMGVAGEVLSRTRLGPRAAVRLAKRYMGLLGAVEVAGDRLAFVDEPVPV